MFKMLTFFFLYNFSFPCCLRSAYNDCILSKLQLNIRPHSQQFIRTEKNAKYILATLHVFVCEEKKIESKWFLFLPWNGIMMRIPPFNKKIFLEQSWFAMIPFLFYFCVYQFIVKFFPYFFFCNQVKVGKHKN